MKKNVFKKSDYVLNDVDNFKQLTNGQHLVTICGEYHDIVKNCSNNNIKSIGDYVEDRVNKNSDISVLLEAWDTVNNGFLGKVKTNFNNIHSKAMKSVYNKIGNNPDKLVLWDIRREFLTTDQQNKLYHKDFMDMKPYVESIERFVDYLNNNRDLVISDYIKDFIEPLMRKIMVKPLVWDIREIWIRIADLIVLNHLRNTEDSEIIVLCGDNHSKNLLKYLTKYAGYSVIAGGKSRGSCIYTYEPVDLQTLIKN